MDNQQRLQLGALVSDARCVYVVQDHKSVSLNIRPAETSVTFCRCCGCSPDLNGIIQHRACCVLTPLR